MPAAGPSPACHVPAGGGWGGGPLLPGAPARVGPSPCAVVVSVGIKPAGGGWGGGPPLPGASARVGPSPWGTPGAALVTWIVRVAVG